MNRNGWIIVPPARWALLKCLALASVTIGSGTRPGFAAASLPAQGENVPAEAREMPAASTGTAVSVRPVDLVSRALAGGERFVEREVLDLLPAYGAAAVPGTPTGAAYYRLNRDRLVDLLRNRPLTLSLVLELGEGRQRLQMVRVDVTSPKFRVSTNDGPLAAPPSQPLHYRGVVEGSIDSLAAISIVDDEIMGLVAIPGKSAVVIGRLAGDSSAIDRPTADHVAFAVDRMPAPPTWTCGTSPYGLPLSPLGGPAGTGVGLPSVSSGSVARCTQVYVEADYDVFLNRGSSVGAVNNYISGLMNQVATLYAHDGIPIVLSELFVWTSPDPYTGSSSQAILDQFQAFRNAFNGHFAMLVDMNNYGGVAVLSGDPCTSNLDNRQGYSGLNLTYNQFPAYSWDVEVFAHELGHLFGSPHTHACAWNGNGTAIDGCWPVEGSCSLPPVPPEGGTVMSYCDLLEGVGVDFALGMGPQPGALMRGTMGGPAGACLGSCPTANVTVSQTGDGTGSYTVTGAFSCGTDCWGVLPGTFAVIESHPAAGSFAFFSGACHGSTTCVITGGADGQVQLRFLKSTTLMASISTSFEPSLPFADGFELGGTTRWSTQPP